MEGDEPGSAALRAHGRPSDRSDDGAVMTQDELRSLFVRHIPDGELDNAALVLGAQTGTIGRFQDSYGGVQAKLRYEGVCAERALRRGS